MEADAEQRDGRALPLEPGGARASARDMATFSSEKAGTGLEVRYRSYRRLAASTGPTVLVLVGLAAAVIGVRGGGPGVVAFGGLALFVVGALGVVLGPKTRGLHPGVPGTLRLEPGALVFEPAAGVGEQARRSLAVAELRVGYAVPTEEGARVWLAGGGAIDAEIGFDCARLEDALALLAEAKLDAAARPYDFHGALIGLEGVVYRGRLAAHRAIERVVVEPRAVSLFGPAGAAMTLPITGEEGALQREAIAARVRAAVAQARREPPAPAWLAREGRELDEWRRAIEGHAESYREATADHDEVEAALRAHGTDVERRIGAALALLASRGEAAGPIIAEVARACVFPPLAELLASMSRGPISEVAVATALERAAEAERDAFGAGA